MKYNREKHHRRYVRLPGHDYSDPGAYFVTICTWDRECIFGQIIDGEMVLNEYGNIVEMCLRQIPDHFRTVTIDEYMIMPNHVHAVFVINNKNNDHGTRRGLINQTPTANGPGSTNHPPETNDNWILMKNPYQTLGKIVRHFKAKSSFSIRKAGLNYFKWQRNYFEHVVRNENELFRIREYIRINPAQWDIDEENPDVRIVP